MQRRSGILALVLAVGLAPCLLAQQIADDKSRREAIQFYRAGREFFAAERFDRAAEEFTKAIGKDPLFTLAHYSLGQSYMNLRRYTSAIKAFGDCIKASRALYDLAETNRFNVEKARDDEIHEMRETIIALQRSGHPLLATRAEQHLRDLETQRTTESAVFRPPAEVLLSLGSAYFRNENPEQAEVEWNAALEVNPKFGEAHNNLAVIYMQTGRYQQAEQAIRNAEQAGFRVNPQLKEDLKKHLAAAPAQ